MDKIKKVKKIARCLYSREEIERGLQMMADEITLELKERNPIFLVILFGGMIPCSNLVLKLDFPLELAYAHLSRFDLDKNKSGEIVWKVKPSCDLSERTVVIVDDILDTGRTIQLVKDYCKKNNARQVYTAVMLDKKVERSPDGLKKADFTGLFVDDQFVFGYGLDYSGYFRNLPGIYGIKLDEAENLL